MNFASWGMVTMTTPTKNSGTQLDKFKQAARDHGADEDEARWEERLKKVAGQKPVPNKPA